GHHAYRRMILESLGDEARVETIAALAVMMGLVKFDNGSYFATDEELSGINEVASRFESEVIDGTLIRRIEKTFFDVDSVHWQKALTGNSGEAPIVFTLRRRELPEPVPASWMISDIDDDKVQVSIRG